MATSKGKSKTPAPEKTNQDHFLDFQTHVTEFLKASQEKVAEAQQEFNEIVSDYQGEYHRSKEEEYRRMLSDVQEAYGQEKSIELVQSAQEKYKANLEEKKEFVEKGIGEAQEKYKSALEKIAEDNRKKYNAAYQALLKNIKSEVTSINLKEVDPEALASIGKSLIQTSQLAPLA